MIQSFNTAFTIIVLMIFFLLIMYFLNDKYYKNGKFTGYLNIISAIGSFILACSVIIAIITFKENNNTMIYHNYLEFQRIFINGIIQLFVKHPEMNYLYEEIFYKKQVQNVHRNYILEHQICMEIFTICEEPITMVTTFQGTDEYINVIEVTFLKILHLLFGSSIVKKFYLSYYKKNIGGPLITNYIEKKMGF